MRAPIRVGFGRVQQAEGTPDYVRIGVIGVKRGVGVRAVAVIRLSRRCAQSQRPEDPEQKEEAFQANRIEFRRGESAASENAFMHRENGKHRAPGWNE